MHIVITLRSLSNLQADKIESALQKWVSSMQPKRKDWLNVLKEFDNKLERLLYFKVQHCFRVLGFFLPARLDPSRLDWYIICLCLVLWKELRAVLFCALILKMGRYPSFRVPSQ